MQSPRFAFREVVTPSTAPAAPVGLVLCPIPFPSAGLGMPNPAFDVYRMAYEKALADSLPSSIDLARRYSLN